MNIFINNNEALKKHCSRISEQPFIAIDTEFIANSRIYYPNLALIQIAYTTPEADKGALRELADPASVISLNEGSPLTILLIDAKANLDWSELQAIFENEAITKVMHSCQQDVLAVRHNMGCNLKGIFDTQIAHAFISQYKTISYRDLVEHYFGVRITKDSQTSNWLKRPLDRRQLDYAANDVDYLYRLYSELREQVCSRNYYDWLVEETANHISELDNDAPRISRYFLSITNESPRLAQDGRGVYLLRLLNFREKMAQKHNFGRLRIIAEQELRELVYIVAETAATQPPVPLLRLAAQHGATPEQVKDLVRPIEESEIAAVQRIIAESERGLDSFYYPLSRYEKLRALLDRISEERGIASALIASNSDLRLLAAFGKSEKIENGWRYDVLGREAATMLQQT